MGTRFDDAKRIAAWLREGEKGEPPSQLEVADRIERAEHEAFLWHCVSLHLTPDERARFEQVAAGLRAAGYRRPE